ncbi:MAG: nucleotidyltransferase domain-containing protein, partial [Verrucomicrobiales bacterium]|nr:nucleotidyltransferase domain-containing protein [Verrucomicrobiales bacterium]
MGSGAFDPNRDTIFLCLGGSHAHGTARNASDIDVRGVGIAPLPSRLSFGPQFEQYEGDLPSGLADRLKQKVATESPPKVETTIFDITKFARLCVDANPNTLEILFTDEAAWLLESPAWKKLWQARHEFLSRKAADTFGGYALAQLKKIKSHRAWLLHPPAGKPTRTDFGLPESGTLSADERNRLEEAIAAKLRTWSIDDLDMPKAARIGLESRMLEFWADVLRTADELTEDAMRAAAARGLGLSGELLEALNREKRYQAERRHWDSYCRWKAERNPARADLEARFGYDTKHGAHLIRLMRMGVELIESGNLKIRRRDADELLQIRDGAWSYDQLVKVANELEKRMKAAVENSPLPVAADAERLDSL